MGRGKQKSENRPLKDQLEQDSLMSDLKHFKQSNEEIKNVQKQKVSFYKFDL